MRQIILFFVFFSFFCFHAPFATAQGSSTETTVSAELKDEPIDVVQIDKDLKKINEDLQSHSLSQNKTQEHIKELNAYHTQLTSLKIQDTEELNSLSKKISALAALTAEGESEPEEITKQRQEFTKRSDEIKARIASADLALEQIDEIGGAC